MGAMRVPSWLILGVAVAATAAPAWAFDTCSGTLGATRMQAPPTPLVVGIDVPDDSPRNLDLAARFRRGLASAGVVVSGTPTALIRITAQVQRAGGATGQGSSTFNGMGFAGEGLTLSPPEIGRRTQTPPQPATLVLRADLTEPKSFKAAWIASVRCTMHGSDGGQLAQDMGALIGGAIGQTVQQKRF